MSDRPGAARSPLLSGDESVLAWKLVRGLQDREASEMITAASISLHGGASGRALFAATLAMECGDQSAAQRAEELINHAVRGCGIGLLSPSLYVGFTGVAWVLHQLLAEASKEPRRAVDEALASDAVLDLVDEPELMNGLAGIAVYALSLREDGWSLLERTVRRICDVSVATQAGRAWPTPRRCDGSDVPPGEVSFRMGVAHGQCGVLWALAHAIARGVPGADRARRLLDESVAWLAMHASDDPKAWSFPRMVGDGDRDSRPQRNVWCWGDASAALVLMDVGRLLGHRDAWELGSRVARATVARRPEDWRVAGAGLCHGAFGAMHVYHRLYLMTEEESFRRIAHDWFLRGVDLLRIETAGGVWPSWDASLEPKLAMLGGGLMDGIAGVALALLTALSTHPKSLTWDSVMALSPPT